MGNGGVEGKDSFYLRVGRISSLMMFTEMRAKILCIVEVSIVFGLMVGLFRFVTSIPWIPSLSESFAGFLFPGYAVLLMVSFFLYIFRCPPQPCSAWPEKLKYQASIIAYGFFPIFVLSAFLNWLDWNQWSGAVLISILEMGLLVWFAWMSKGKPAWQNSGIVGSFLLFAVASHAFPRLGNVTLAVMYFYLFVGLGEELLFRGYIQSRLNSVFGCPKHFLGIHWGWGLIMASVFFGLWHFDWQLSMLKWPQVLWTMFGGVVFGFVREKSESVIAPAILHGLLNYGPQAILYYLLWNK